MLLVSSGAEDVVRMWDVQTGQQVFEYQRHHRPPEVSPLIPPELLPPPIEIGVVAWSPDGNSIASGDTAGLIHVWAAWGANF